MPTKKFNVIGQPLRKVDAAAKVLGRTVFADDIFLPQMLYAKLLRSTRPHARIVRVDTTAAETMEGDVQGASQIPGYERGLRGGEARSVPAVSV